MQHGQGQVDADEKKRREERLLLLDKSRDQWTSTFPPVRDGEEIDWRQRKWLLRTTFRGHGILDIAEGRLTRDQLSTAEGAMAFDRQQCKIQRLVAMAIPPHRLQQVDHLETGTEMWAAVNEIYERRMDPMIRESVILRKSEELRDLKCSPTSDVNIHLSKMFRIRSELRSYGYEANDINMKQMMLDSLPELYEYEQLRGGVKYGGNGGTLTPDALRVLIEQAAERQSRRRGSQRQQHGGGAGGRQQQQGKNNPQSDGQGKPKRDKKCHRCGKPGHFRAHCPETVDGVPGPGARGTGGDGAGTQMRQQRTNFTSSDGKGLADKREVVEDEPGVTAGVEVPSPAVPAAGTKSEDGESTKPLTKGSSWWCFDTGSNVHLTGDRSVFVHLEDIHPESMGANVVGVAATTLTRASGIGRVKIITLVDNNEVEIFLDDVLYVEGAAHGLFSMHLALAQGFEVSYDRTASTFSVYKDGQQMIFAVPEEGIWVFEGRSAAAAPRRLGVTRVTVNYTVADGVATLEQWHNRTGHTNVQYLKIMADRGLVRGMMITNRQIKTCDSCHVGKQRQKRRQKGLDRQVTAPNMIVYADLMFPPQNNGSRFVAVLVIMDGWSRYLTVYMLTDKSGATVNKYMQRYVLWAERQAGRGIMKIIQREYEPAESTRFPVQRVLTDKGGEFVNKDMGELYEKHGIEHIKVGPKSSHLNAVERAIQSLSDYTKTQMLKSGFPRSFWWYALVYGVYIKNMVYHRAIDGIPIQRMLGVKADVHHLRPFGSLVYIQVPNTPERSRNDDNAIIGYLLGFEMDTVGARVYIPSENTVKFVAEMRVCEDVMYGDRHHVDPAKRDNGEWLRFSMEDVGDDDATSISSDNGVDMDSIHESSYSSVLDIADDAETIVSATVAHEASMADADQSEHDEDHGVDDRDDDQSEEGADDHGSVFSDDDSDNYPVEDNGEDGSVSANYGSEVDPEEHGSATQAAEVGKNERAPTLGHAPEAEGRSEADSSSKSTAGGNDSNTVGGGATTRTEPPFSELDVQERVVLPAGLRKRVERDDTPSEAEKNQLGERVKGRRTGLRERRPPARFDDFVRWANVATKILGRDGRPIGANNIKIPKNRRQAMRSKYADFWRMAELEEMAALKSKAVWKRSTEPRCQRMLSP
jgi:transposase InsO family protein